MGWSCSADSSFVLDRITREVSIPLDGSSNSLPGKAFFQPSRREHEDGSITGGVYCSITGRLVGSFRVSGRGKIVRFPRLPRKLWAGIESRAAADNYSTFFRHPGACEVCGTAIPEDAEHYHVPIGGGHSDICLSCGDDLRGSVELLRIG